MASLVQGAGLYLLRSYSHPLMACPTAKSPGEIVGVDRFIRWVCREAIATKSPLLKRLSSDAKAQPDKELIYPINLESALVRVLYNEQCVECCSALNTPGLSAYRFLCLLSRSLSHGAACADGLEMVIPPVLQPFQQFQQWCRLPAALYGWTETHKGKPDTRAEACEAIASHPHPAAASMEYLV